jgi:hypothetical protein
VGLEAEPIHPGDDMTDALTHARRIGEET